MDALSDVLSAVRLDGAVYVNAEFTAPWCVATQYGLHSAAPKLPDTDHVVFFHLLTEGSCLVRLAGGTEESRVEAGDLLLLAHDDLHVLGSDLNLQIAEVRSAPPQSGLLEFRAGGGGEATKFICGYLACDRRASRALLGSLPPMLRVSLGDVSRGGWLADLLRLGVEESRAQRPGSQSLLAKLSELAFTEALPPLRAVQSTRAEGLARGATGPLCRPRACASAWRADAGLDGGGSLARSRTVALGAGGAVFRNHRSTADAISDAVAAHSGRASAARGQREHRPHRRAQRLRLGSRLHARVQARIRRAADRMAQD